MRQKSILLAFVKAVYLIDKHQGAPLRESIARLLRPLHRLADFLDTA